jgi:hypothetical protein
MRPIGTENAPEIIELKMATWKPQAALEAKPEHKGE